MSQELRCPDCGAEDAELIDPDHHQQIVRCHTCDNSSPNPLEWHIEYNNARMTDREREALREKRDRALAQQLPRPPRDRVL
jgi:uncharacterized Zn finger protein